MSKIDITFRKCCICGKIISYKDAQDRRKVKVISEYIYSRSSFLPKDAGYICNGTTLIHVK